MKNLYYFSILCCLIFASCQRDTEILDNAENIAPNSTRITENIESSKIETGFNNSNRGANRLTEAQNFELKMAWASFISAKIIYNHGYDTTFKNTLTSLINNRVVALEDLVGPNSQFQAFNNEFKTELAGYIENIWCPGDSEENPNGIVITNPDGTNGLMTTARLVDHYLDFVLNANCIELYFPVGVQAGEVETVSMAHPLTNNYANNGFERNAIGCNSTQGFWIVPNYIYVNRTSMTFVIARPVRETGAGPCSYLEYADVNFTRFMGADF